MNQEFAQTPDAKLSRARLSLTGLGIGDALGEMFAQKEGTIRPRVQADDLPPPPWFHTDDTEMAIAVLDVLQITGTIDQDALARAFQDRYARDPDRGYGKALRMQMRAQMAGSSWRELAEAAFGGQGSMGNGSAMRVGPLGAWFAEDMERVVHEAGLSARVTHSHPEGVAGAIAVAVAAAKAVELCHERQAEGGRDLLEEVLHWTPESETRTGVALALDNLKLPSAAHGVAALGRGSLVTCPDTVPFALWAAARHLYHFPEAICEVIEGGGDCDTNAAIVGSIVSLAVGWEGIPSSWMEAREKMY